jgi:hypothetical protein
MAINRDINTLKHLTLSHLLVAEVAEFRARAEFASEAEAFRFLIRKGIDATREEAQMLREAKEQRRQMAA